MPTSISGASDPADEAGGEVIYSSDGLEPLPITRPPQSVRTTFTGSSSDDIMDTDGVLDSDQMPPQTAFEVFRGKVYSTAIPMSMKVSEDGGSALERLARCLQEVTALEAEFQTTAPDSGRDFDEQLIKLAADLKSRLNAVASTSVPEQDELSRMIRQQVEQLQQQQQNTQQTDGTSTSADSTTIGKSTLPETGIVYELYGNATNPTTTMEERLLRLENLFGNPQNPSPLLGKSNKATSGGGSSLGSHPRSLLYRLEEMESLVSTIDAATLEQTATKAKVIRADLEAASKARNKLTATYKKEDSKMIQQLYQQMVDLEGLSSYLPSLVERLQQLSTLHQQGSTFGLRLQELERGTTQLEATIGQLEVGMVQLQEAMVQNIHTLETNLQKLDDTLKGL